MGAEHHEGFTVDGAEHFESVTVAARARPCGEGRNKGLMHREVRWRQAWQQTGPQCCGREQASVTVR